VFYVRLGGHGPRVPGLAIGLWQAGRLWPGRRRGVEEAVARAVEAGLLFFDTAELYGAGASERLLGGILSRLGALGDAFIVTKLAGYRVTWNGFRKALEASARRLGRKPDLVLYHWPPPYPFSVCHVTRLLERAVDSGLVSYIGVSNFNAGELERAVECTRRYEILVDQVQYNMFFRVVEHRLMRVASRLHVSLMAWSPLAKGVLAGKTVLDAPAKLLDPVFHRARRAGSLLSELARMAGRYNSSMASLALSWIIARGAIPVVGVSSPSHVDDALRALRLAGEEGVVRELMALTGDASVVEEGCYRVLHWNRLIPPPLQLVLYRVVLGGI